MNNEQHLSAGHGAESESTMTANNTGSRRARALLKSSVALVAAGLLIGCDSKGWFNPTEIGVRSGHPTEPLVVPILTNLDPSVEKGPADFANATLPRPSDLVSANNDYRIGRNDLLNISISDLMAPGQETIKVSRVSESGNISLPYLGAVHAEGLTEIELEQTIVQAYRDANLIQNSQVSVTVVEARGRTVEILGSVQQPGQYAILDTDFRLLDALVQAKDVTTPLIEYIYVIRRGESRRTTAPTTRPATAPRNGAPHGPATIPAPEDLAPHSDATVAPQPQARATSANHPLTLLADAPAPLDLAPGAGSAPAARPKAAPAPAAGGGAQQGKFEFNSATDDAGATRVIKIPYGALKSGNLEYNIAIHPRDLIIVQPLPVGEYYVGGHVARPGVYTLSGRRITLKQSVVSAGGFDDLAIPQRTEVIRRIRPDREVFVRVDLERIYSGETPDIFLRPDDQIMVGTNALAPFLSAFRGAFRLTYGFGFLYDRNYAYNSLNQGF